MATQVTTMRTTMRTMRTRTTRATMRAMRAMKAILKKRKASPRVQRRVSFRERVAVDSVSSSSRARTTTTL